MMPPTTVQALGQAQLAELHRQAQRDALARAARRARRARRRQPGYRKVLAARPACFLAGTGNANASTSWAGRSRRREPCDLHEQPFPRSL